MPVYKGCVMSKADVLGKGLLTVCPTGAICDDPKNWISVKYVSFYGGGDGHSGAAFIPEPNTEILYDYVENDTTNSYYYLGVVLDPQIDIVQTQEIWPDDHNPATGDEQTLWHDEDDGKDNSQSMSYGWSTPLGHHLLMRENRTSTKSSTQVSLKSAAGHGLLLNDVAHADGVLLYSAFQKAYIRLTPDYADDTPGGIGPEGVDIYCGGNMSLHSSEGGISMSVQDGKNIEILNHSTQSHGATFRRSRSGNVIIGTDNGDVRISSKGNGVFIDCYGASRQDGTTAPSVQIRSQNKIHLYSDNGIDLKSLGDINIRGKNVNIESDVAQNGKINLNPLTTSVDNSIKLRKTNLEIDYETLFGWFPFFLNPLWSLNYTGFNNTDPNL